MWVVGGIFGDLGKGINASFDKDYKKCQSGLKPKNQEVLESVSNRKNVL